METPANAYIIQQRCSLIKISQSHKVGVKIIG